MTQAAVLIQSQFRSYYAQKRFKRSRQAATVIQNQYRTYKQHERFKKSRNAAVIIQQRFRSVSLLHQCKCSTDSTGYYVLYIFPQCKVISLVSAGHLCDLQGLFSEIYNLCAVNRNELQFRDVVTSYTWRRVFADTYNL